VQVAPDKVIHAGVVAPASQKHFFPAELYVQLVWIVPSQFVAAATHALASSFYVHVESCALQTVWVLTPADPVKSEHYLTTHAVVAEGEVVVALQKSL